MHPTELIKYTKQTGEQLYKLGFRVVCSEQNGISYVTDDMPANEPKTHWGSGLYVLNEDGTLGDCLHFNYDSSD